MRSKGKITTWNDDKGYGFVTPFDGGKQVFIHVKAFRNRGRRPQVDDIVTFTLSTDGNGRPCAAEAVLAGSRVVRKPPAPGRANAALLTFAGLFMVAVGLSALAGPLHVWVAIAYAVLGLVTFAAYAWDKSAARRNSWRTKETTLHVLALAGGWPGALIAQELLRHKSRKTGFRILFWATVLINLAALVWLHTDEGRAALESLSRDLLTGRSAVVDEADHDGRLQSARILNAGRRRAEPGLFIKRDKLPKLSAREVRALGSFLGHADRPEGTLSFHELQGFLFAIACAPELIRPSEWLPLISNDEDMRYADLREAQHILGLIMVLYNQINASVIERSDAMPSGCAFLEDTVANLEERAPVSQWSRGFVEGHNWLQDLWTEYVPDDSTELSKEFGACMMTLSFFSSRQIAEALYREGSGRAKPIQPEGFARLAATMRNLFPSALASYADIGRSIAEASRSDG